MTVAAVSRRQAYTASGSTTGPFSVPFGFFEIDVYLDGALVDPADYTISQASAGATGNITFDVAPTGALVIVGNTRKVQETDYVANDAFPASSHELALDRLTMIVQELDLLVSHSVRVPVTQDEPDELDAAGNPSSFVFVDATGAFTLKSSAAVLADFDSEIQDLLDSITEAAASAAASAASALASSSSASSAAAALDAFDDIYLGSKASDPTLDNDGDALNSGDMFWHTGLSALKVYDGASWQAINAYTQAGTGAVSRTWQDKARESISFYDFGAVGDGTTDDSAAINLAIDYAATISGDFTTEATTEGAFVEVTGCGGKFLVSDSVRMNSSSHRGIFITQAKLIADATADWGDDLSGVTISGAAECGVNSTVTITSANPGVVTWTAHRFIGGEAVRFTTTGALPGTLAVGTTYYVSPSGITDNTFRLLPSAVAAPLPTAIDTSSGAGSGTHTCHERAIRLTHGAATLLTTNENRQITGVLGTTEANDYWRIRVIDSTHTDLMCSVFTNAYVSGGEIEPFPTEPVIDIALGSARCGVKNVYIHGNHVANGIRASGTGSTREISDCYIYAYKRYGLKNEGGADFRCFDNSIWEWFQNEAGWKQAWRTGRGVWLEVADSQVRGCTIFWTDWGIYLDGVSPSALQGTAMISGCHPYNGGNGNPVVHPRIIYVGANTAGTIFSDNYYDQGHIEIRSPYVMFDAGRFTKPVSNTYLDAYFNLVPSSINQTLGNFKIGGAYDFPDMPGGIPKMFKVRRTVASQSTVTITSANPGVVTWTAHGFSGGEALLLETTGVLPSSLHKTITYYVLPTGLTVDTFRVATSAGGTAIDTSASAGSGTHTAFNVTANFNSATEAIGAAIVPRLDDLVMDFICTDASRTVVGRFQGSSSTFADLQLKDRTTTVGAGLRVQGDTANIFADSSVWGIEEGAWRPGADNSQDVGSTSKRIRDIWMNGQLSIGTITPSAGSLLHVSDNTWVEARVENTDGSTTGSSYFLQNGADYWQVTHRPASLSNPIGFAYNGDYKLTLTSAGLLGVGTATPIRLGHFALHDTTDTSVSFPLRVDHSTSGTPTAGIGTGVEFVTETTAGAFVGSHISSASTDVSSGSEDFDLLFFTAAGGALAKRARFPSTGGLALPDSNGSHDVIFKPTSNVTAERTISFVTGDADRTIDLTKTGNYVGGIRSGTIASVTGTTTETELLRIPLDAGLSAAARIEVEFTIQKVGTAGAVVPRVRFEATGTALASMAQCIAPSSAAANTQYTGRCVITNRNSQSSQFVSFGVTAGWGGNTGTPVTTGVNTAAATDIVISAALADGTDLAYLESCIVRVINA